MQRKRKTPCKRPKHRALAMYQSSQTSHNKFPLNWRDMPKTRQERETGYAKLSVCCISTQVTGVFLDIF
ncbi:unnamed protein product [Fusarium graminearum]|nr:unnamed protein product [Fusarium graminearum]CAG1988937.1 unnamed protein product [Fusarium graminearum]VTO83875.1 unnamed protein product [Fusarium graminearum]